MIIDQSGPLAATGTLFTLNLVGSPVLSVRVLNNGEGSTITYEEAETPAGPWTTLATSTSKGVINLSPTLDIVRARVSTYVAGVVHCEYEFGPPLPQVATVSSSVGALEYNISQFGGVADGKTNVTPAIFAAIQAGAKTIVFDEGALPFLMTTPTSLGNGVQLRAGKGKPTIKIKLNTGSRAFTLNGRTGVVMDGLRFDGSENVTRNDAFIVFSTGATRNLITRCDFYKTPGGGTGGIVFSSLATDNEVSYCRFDECVYTTIGMSNASANRVLYNRLFDCGHSPYEGFGVRVAEGSSKNLIHGNSVTNQGIEGVGVYHDAFQNKITLNHCESCGDNGISISGYENIVDGNHCYDNERAGIGIWGSFNNISNNQCWRNGAMQNFRIWRAGLAFVPGDQISYSAHVYTATTSGTTVGSVGPTHTTGTAADPNGVNWDYGYAIPYWSGIWIGCGFGGTGQYNIIANNVCEDDRPDSDTRTQYMGVRLQSNNGYTGWAATTAVSAGAYRVAGLHIYLAMTSGTTSAVQPTHTSGDAVDGTVTWRYIRSFISNWAIRGNQVFNNIALRSKSGQAYNDVGNWAQNTLIAHQYMSMAVNNVLGVRMEFPAGYANDAAAATAGIPVGQLYRRTTGEVAQRLT
jgi:hypothetical protein